MDGPEAATHSARIGPRDYAHVFLRLKYEFSDDIPAEFVSRDAHNRAFKVRNNWFNDVSGYAYLLIRDGHAEQDVQHAYARLCGITSEPDFHLRRKTAADIAAGNDLLELCLRDAFGIEGRLEYQKQKPVAEPYR